MTPSLPSARERVGTLLDARYRLTRLLGEGGMGAVFEADDARMRRRVAVKLMNPSFSKHPEATQRFLREAQTAAQLSHPHVVTVHDLGVEPESGSFYLVQEFLTGCDLRAVLQQLGALRLDEALSVMLPALEGLRAAHDRGVVHRDLKPDNIFLARAAGAITPKVIDFGIAKAMEHQDQDFRTRTMQILGTPGYMSREQARALGGLDGRTDVWSAAVVLYELLSGQLPYDAPNAHAMLARILTEAPRPLAVLRPDLPESFLYALDGALQPERDARHPTMAAFIDELRACEVPLLREPPRIAALLGVTPAEPSVRTPAYTPTPPRASEAPRTPPPAMTAPSHPAMTAPSHPAMFPPPRPPTALAWSDATPAPPRARARSRALPIGVAFAAVAVAAVGFALTRTPTSPRALPHAVTHVTEHASSPSPPPTPVRAPPEPEAPPVPAPPVAAAPPVIAPAPAVTPSPARTREPSRAHEAARRLPPTVHPLAPGYVTPAVVDAPPAQVGTNGAVILN